MINLDTFFKNHFDTKEISDNNMKLFSEVHLQRITANNPGGIYSTRITAFTTAYTGYFGAISDEDLKQALQEGLTITMNNAMKDFVKNVRQKEGTIKGQWGKDSAQYQEFIPHGLDEYNHMNLSNAELLMNRIVNASTAHVADLGAPFVTLFTNLRTTFTDARTAQLAVMGQVSGLKDTSSTTRDALETELMTNVLFIGMNNIGHPERVSMFFSQSIIHKTAGGSTEKTITINVLPNTVGNFDLSDLGINFEKVVTIKFESKVSDGDFYAGETETSEPGATKITVPADESATRTAENAQLQLGADETHTKINVKNTGTATGQYTLTLTVEE